MIGQQNTISMPTKLATVTMMITTEVGTIFAEILRSLHRQSISGKEMCGTLEALRSQERRMAGEEG